MGMASDEPALMILEEKAPNKRDDITHKFGSSTRDAAGLALEHSKISGAAAMKTEQSIYTLAQRVFSNLKALSGAPATFHEAEKARDRFQKWCNSLGAHLQGTYSLDERLRDASVMKEYILDCLAGMNTALEEAQDPNSGQDSDPSSSPINSERASRILIENSAMASPMGFANSIQGVLFRLTPIIRPALSADRCEKAMSTTIPDEEDFKVRCSKEIRHFFPRLSSELLPRLVQASLLRRRFTQYAMNYSARFRSDVYWASTSAEINPSNVAGPPTGKANSEASDSHGSIADPNLSLSGIITREDASHTLRRRSVISFAESHHALTSSIPPFPEDSDGGLRECVACHLLLPLPTEQLWRGHIIKDIRPYVCTFTDCTVDPGKLYSSRHAWFEHELAFHRRQWPCPSGCATILTDIESFREHVESKHGTRAQQLLSHPLPRGLELPPDAEAICPFCQESIKSRQKIGFHIALHQLEIGLMVLQSPVSMVSGETVLAEDSEEELPPFPVIE
ncbi:hypothetical protein X797_008966 [Metarhizium robertsii]|uniref:Protein kinase domain containing protein n=2 Tax=Metarhizium robertsii TaxID=568076 RepID=E9F8L1_METRA|nr:Protein kinase domain containing protein [Metarhizium robertsii ARSEF 23]EFY95957.2 Protein kinase domain containing protein [Metarhizium robertsii ARSEF 23]EXU97967.1 hypothetical protein X797_008966 [Metarhizium robertsii]